MESLYLMWRTTGERRWREYAWRIFESIEKHTKTESGYASVRIEGNGSLTKENEMPRYVILVLSDEPLAEVIRFSSWQFLPCGNVGFFFTSGQTWLTWAGSRLKYLYLTFLDHDPIDLEKWVFSTEAHPLPVFQWTAEEKSLFGIP